MVTEAHAQRRQNPSQETLVDEISLVAQTRFGSVRNFQNRRVHLALRSPLLPTPAPATRPVPSPRSRCPRHRGPACSEQALGSALFAREGRTPFLPASASRCFLPEPRRRTVGMPLTLFEALTAAATWGLGGVRAPKEQMVHSGGHSCPTHCLTIWFPPSQIEQPVEGRSPEGCLALLCTKPGLPSWKDELFPPPPVPLWGQTAVRGLRAGEQGRGRGAWGSPASSLSWHLSGRPARRGLGAVRSCEGRKPGRFSPGGTAWGEAEAAVLTLPWPPGAALRGPPSPQPAPAQGSSVSSCCSILLRSCSSYFLVFCSRHASALGGRCHGWCQVFVVFFHLYF